MISPEKLKKKLIIYLKNKDFIEIELYTIYQNTKNYEHFIVTMSKEHMIKMYNEIIKNVHYVEINNKIKLFYHKCMNKDIMIKIYKEILFSK